ncbi:Beta-glucuronidase [Citrobacter werkmanii]|nr:Beta-glucuronidase [Citrobacter werkmanii]
MVHDHALMEWIGANSYRTSHYPYAEEMLDWADEQGIVIIDETAAVGFNLSLGIGFDACEKPTSLYGDDAINDRTQLAHLQAIRELIARDKTIQALSCGVLPMNRIHVLKGRGIL